MDEGRVPENRLKIIGASASVLCVRMCVCWIAGGRDGRQGCKGEEVARKQKERRNTDMLFCCIVCTEALEAGETKAARRSAKTAYEKSGDEGATPQSALALPQM